MKFSELKQKVTDFLKKSEEKSLSLPKYSFRESIQYKQMNVVIGFVMIFYLLSAFAPSYLNLPLITISQDTRLTIINLFPIIIVVCVMLYSCESIGSWALDTILDVGDDIKNKVKPSAIVVNSLVLILFVTFIVFKLIFTTSVGGVK